MRFLLRGIPDAPGVSPAFISAFGSAPPAPGESLDWGRGSVLWFAADAWMVLSDQEDQDLVFRDLEQAVAGSGALIDVSSGWSSLRVEGPAMRDLMARGCPLDLDPAKFPPGSCARSLLGPFPVLLHSRREIAAFDLHVARSYGAALAHWLEGVAELLPAPQSGARQSRDTCFCDDQ